MSPDAASAGTRRVHHAELAWVDGAARSDVTILAEGERIVDVRAGTSPPAEATRLDGFVVPGLANVHSHAFHRALRARTHQGAGDFWGWRERMYAIAGVLDPDRYHRLATAVFAEMALAGVTAVGEFHYLHHAPDGASYADPNAMGRALAEAARAAGIRLTLLDTCYLRGGFDRRELTGPQRRFGDGDVHRWAARASDLSDGPRLRRGAAIHSVRAVPADAMPTVVAWADAREAPLHVHVSEQPAENAACREATGRTPTGVLAEHGVLGPRLTAVHATHLDDADIAALGGATNGVCLCPTTERELADGVGPARAIADAGSPLCVGSDSHAVIDLFEEARAIELNERLVTGERGHHSPERLLAAATTDGHRQLGWDVALRPGALADFVAIDLASPRTAGATAATAGAHAIFAATASDVTDVIVGGEPVVRDRVHQRIDVPDALARALAEVEEAIA
ncbi:formimidoylglutamate deiminase [Egibacter rhizosphaerae]|uniref:Formimidoylglutamate deiminase n=1 Tax=Egibacter rhizosphaerae TaxID=1670831 RepID=A0A411YAW1_9ACTN|nr:formimidoylglutamate deiminase [Egibacter rhizosphaerae]QBI18317.1 formimidoylglutamate deiminase [Egibacter rhizosphaerae]